MDGDFLIAYAQVFSLATFPKTADISQSDHRFRVDINGVESDPDIAFGIERVTRTNRFRTGEGTIRYAKNKPLDQEVGADRSSALFRRRKMIVVQDDTELEEKLSLNLDCATGKFFA